MHVSKVSINGVMASTWIIVGSWLGSLPSVAVELTKQSLPAVVVAVTIVLMVQVAVDQVVNVVAVRDRFMSTAGAVDVVGCVAAAHMSTRTGCRIVRVHRQYVFFHDAFGCRMMQMPIMQIINVVTMNDCRVPTTLSMYMGMIGV